MSENQLSEAFCGPASGGTATTLVVLAERARLMPFEPWLFYRDGWDWCWRSWGRVADQVVRSAAVLRGAAAQTRRVGYNARQHPDAVAAGLAIQAAGKVAVPVFGGPQQAASLGCGVWVGMAAGEEPASRPLERVELPPVLSPTGRTEPRRLVVDAAAALGTVALKDGFTDPPPGALRELPPEACMRAACRLDGALTPAAGRAIVCAAPGLDLPAVQLLEAWTLLRDAAWVLEPQADAFIETVLWARPTLVWGRAGDLEQLAVRLSRRKDRRRKRLTGVVVAGRAEAECGTWDALGVRIVALGEDPLQSRGTRG